MTSKSPVLYNDYQTYKAEAEAMIDKNKEHFDTTVQNKFANTLGAIADTGVSTMSYGAIQMKGIENPGKYGVYNSEFDEPTIVIAKVILEDIKDLGKYAYTKYRANGRTVDDATKLAEAQMANMLKVVHTSKNDVFSSAEDLRKGIDTDDTKRVQNVFTLLEQFKKVDKNGIIYTNTDNIFDNPNVSFLKANKGYENGDAHLFNVAGYIGDLPQTVKAGGWETVIGAMSGTGLFSGMALLGDKSAVIGMMDDYYAEKSMEAKANGESFSGSALAYSTAQFAGGVAEMFATNYVLNKFAPGLGKTDTVSKVRNLARVLRPLAIIEGQGALRDLAYSSSGLHESYGDSKYRENRSSAFWASRLFDAGTFIGSSVISAGVKGYMMHLAGAKVAAGALTQTDDIAIRGLVSQHFNSMASKRIASDLVFDGLLDFGAQAAFDQTEMRFTATQKATLSLQDKGLGEGLRMIASNMGMRLAARGIMTVTNAKTLGAYLMEKTGETKSDIGSNKFFVSEGPKRNRFIQGLYNASRVAETDDIANIDREMILAPSEGRVGLIEYLKSPVGLSDDQRQKLIKAKGMHIAELSMMAQGETDIGAYLLAREALPGINFPIAGAVRYALRNRMMPEVNLDGKPVAQYTNMRQYLSDYTNKNDEVADALSILYTIPRAVRSAIAPNNNETDIVKAISDSVSNRILTTNGVADDATITRTVALVASNIRLSDQQHSAVVQAVISDLSQATSRQEDVISRMTNPGQQELEHLAGLKRATKTMESLISNSAVRKLEEKAFGSDRSDPVLKPEYKTTKADDDWFTSDILNKQVNGKAIAEQLDNSAIEFNGKAYNARNTDDFKTLINDLRDITKRKNPRGTLLNPSNSDTWKANKAMLDSFINEVRTFVDNFDRTYSNGKPINPAILENESKMLTRITAEAAKNMFQNAVKQLSDFANVAKSDPNRAKTFKGLATKTFMFLQRTGEQYGEYINTEIGSLIKRVETDSNLRTFLNDVMKEGKIYHDDAIDAMKKRSTKGEFSVEVALDHLYNSAIDVRYGKQILSAAIDMQGSHTKSMQFLMNLIHGGITTKDYVELWSSLLGSSQGFQVSPEQIGLKVNGKPLSTTDQLLINGAITDYRFKSNKDASEIIRILTSDATSAERRKEMFSQAVAMAMLKLVAVRKGLPAGSKYITSVDTDISSLQKLFDFQFEYANGRTTNHATSALSTGRQAPLTNVIVTPKTVGILDNAKQAKVFMKPVLDIIVTANNRSGQNNVIIPIDETFDKAKGFYAYKNKDGKFMKDKPFRDIWTSMQKDLVDLGHSPTSDLITIIRSAKDFDSAADMVHAYLSRTVRESYHRIDDQHAEPRKYSTPTSTKLFEQRGRKHFAKQLVMEFVDHKFVEETLSNPKLLRSITSAARTPNAASIYTTRGNLTLVSIDDKEIKSIFGRTNLTEEEYVKHFNLLPIATTGVNLGKQFIVLTGSDLKTQASDILVSMKVMYDESSELDTLLPNTATLKNMRQDINDAIDKINIDRLDSEEEFTKAMHGIVLDIVTIQRKYTEDYLKSLPTNTKTLTNTLIEFERDGLFQPLVTQLMGFSNNMMIEQTKADVFAFLSADDTTRTKITDDIRNVSSATVKLLNSTDRDFDANLADYVTVMKSVSKDSPVMRLLSDGEIDSYIPGRTKPFSIDALQQIKPIAEEMLRVYSEFFTLPKLDETFKTLEKVVPSISSVGLFTALDVKNTDPEYAQWKQASDAIDAITNKLKYATRQLTEEKLQAENRAVNQIGAEVNRQLTMGALSQDGNANTQDGVQANIRAMLEKNVKAMDAFMLNVKNVDAAGNSKGNGVIKAMQHAYNIAAYGELSYTMDNPHKRLSAASIRASYLDRNPIFQEASIQSFLSKARIVIIEPRNINGKASADGNIWLGKNFWKIFQGESRVSFGGKRAFNIGATQIKQMWRSLEEDCAIHNMLTLDTPTYKSKLQETDLENTIVLTTDAIKEIDPVLAELLLSKTTNYSLPDYGSMRITDSAQASLAQKLLEGSYRHSSPIPVGKEINRALQAASIDNKLAFLSNTGYAKSFTAMHNALNGIVTDTDLMFRHPDQWALSINRTLRIPKKDTGGFAIIGNYEDTTVHLQDRLVKMKEAWEGSSKTSAEKALYELYRVDVENKLAAAEADEYRFKTPQSVFDNMGLGKNEVLSKARLGDNYLANLVADKLGGVQSDRTKQMPAGVEDAYVRLNNSIIDDTKVDQKTLVTLMDFLADEKLGPATVMKLAVSGQPTYIIFAGRTPYIHDNALTGSVVTGIARNFDGIEVNGYHQFIQNADFDGDQVAHFGFGVHTYDSKDIKKAFSMTKEYGARIATTEDEDLLASIARLNTRALRYQKMYAFSLMAPASEIKVKTEFPDDPPQAGASLLIKRFDDALNGANAAALISDRMNENGMEVRLNDQYRNKLISDLNPNVNKSVYLRLDSSDTATDSWILYDGSITAGKSSLKFHGKVSQVDIADDAYFLSQKGSGDENVYKVGYLTTFGENAQKNVYMFIAASDKTNPGIKIASMVRTNISVLDAPKAAQHLSETIQANITTKKIPELFDEYIAPNAISNKFITDVKLTNIEAIHRQIQNAGVESPKDGAVYNFFKAMELDRTFKETNEDIIAAGAKTSNFLSTLDHFVASVIVARRIPVDSIESLDSKAYVESRFLYTGSDTTKEMRSQWMSHGTLTTRAIDDMASNIVSKPPEEFSPIRFTMSNYKDIASKAFSSKDPVSFEKFITSYYELAKVKEILQSAAFLNTSDSMEFKYRLPPKLMNALMTINAMQDAFNKLAKADNDTLKNLGIDIKDYIELDRSNDFLTLKPNAINPSRPALADAINMARAIEIARTSFGFYGKSSPSGAINKYKIVESQIATTRELAGAGTEKEMLVSVADRASRNEAIMITPEDVREFLLSDLKVSEVASRQGVSPIMMNLILKEEAVGGLGMLSTTDAKRINKELNRQIHETNENYDNIVVFKHTTATGNEDIKNSVLARKIVDLERSLRMPDEKTSIEDMRKAPKQLAILDAFVETLDKNTKAVVELHRMGVSASALDKIQFDIFGNPKITKDISDTFGSSIVSRVTEGEVNKEVC